MPDHLSDASARRIRESFAAQSMMQSFGARIAHIGAGEVWVAAPLAAGALQQQGFGHAALTFGLGDTAAGYAALTLFDEDQEVLTAEMKINLLAPASGPLLAKGCVIKPGRRLVVAEAQVFANPGTAQERLAAILLGTLVPVAA